jgi:site-specific recombinase XerD
MENINNLHNLIAGYKLSCQTEGKSPKTIEWYQAFLLRFLAFLEKHDLPQDIRHITRLHIKEFIHYLQTEAKTPHTYQPLAPATVQGYVRTLKTFFAWAYREEYLENNPVSRIPPPKAPQKVLQTFSDEHITKLTTLCRNGNGTGHRNLTIILLMLDTGIRVSELACLDLDSINMEGGYFTIHHGKGGKERIVPFGSLVQNILWKYINYYRTNPLTAQIDQLFLSDSGLPLTRNGIQQMLRRYAAKAKLKGVRCSPHTFRHTFAKNYLLNGGDIFSLQKILGHSSLHSVRIYLNLFGTDLKKQHTRFSPVDTLAKDANFHRLYR